jgi:hypothetical protein
VAIPARANDASREKVRLGSFRQQTFEILPRSLLSGIVVVFTPFGVNLVPTPILRVVVALCFWIAPLLINKLSDKLAE